MRRLILAALALATVAAPALAHEPGRVELPGTAADALVFALIAIAGMGYAIGVRNVWREAGSGRGIAFMPPLSFAAGLALLAASLSSAVDGIADRSFAAHMAQHEALMLLVAPLLVAGRPLAAWAWALPPRSRAPVRRAFATPALRAPWSALTSLHGASLVQLVLLLVWHLPRMFDAALANAWLHALQHVCFLAPALAFWWALMRPGAIDRAWQSAFALFVTMVASGALGAMLAVAPRPWYAAYQAVPGALEDQALGGLIMWVPGGTVYVVAAIAILARWLQRAPRHTGFRAAAEPLR